MTACEKYVAALAYWLLWYRHSSEDDPVSAVGKKILRNAMLHLSGFGFRSQGSTSPSIPEAGL